MNDAWLFKANLTSLRRFFPPFPERTAPVASVPVRRTMCATRNGCRSGLVWAWKARNFRVRLLSTPGGRASPGHLLVYRLTRWVIVFPFDIVLTNRLLYQQTIVVSLRNSTTVEKLFGRLRQKDTIRSEIFLITRQYYTILVCSVVHSRLYIPIRTFGELPVSDIFQSTRHKLTRTGLYRRMLYRARFPCPLPTRIYHIFFLVFDARALFKERCIPNILARWRYT